MMTKFIDQGQRPLKNELQRPLKDALQDEKLNAAIGGVTYSNLAIMRHEMLKTVANNLRA
jgi:hypothetical protein